MHSNHRRTLGPHHSDPSHRSVGRSHRSSTPRRNWPTAPILRQAVAVMVGQAEGIGSNNPCNPSPSRTRRTASPPRHHHITHLLRSCTFACSMTRRA
eukprot:3010606-Prymnesium_polylepis.1